MNPLDKPFTYFGVNFLGFEWPAIKFKGPATGPLIGSGEDDSVTEELSVAGVVVGMNLNG